MGEAKIIMLIPKLNVDAILKVMVEYWYIWLLLIICFCYRLLRPKIKGIVGEKAVALILLRLNRTKYIVINNVVLKVGGKTTQIDHLVISDFGLFVIETKNYKGWILGGENSEYWTQVIFKRKEKLYNPIRQNYGHVQALKYYLREFSNVKYIPIVVFSLRSTLKVNTVSEVVNTAKLIKTIKKYREIILEEFEKEAILEKINSVNIKSTTYNYRKHILSIQQRTKERKKLIENNICPHCGGNLILRRSKFGKFKGCSNFPKCTFSITN
ncbi:MAG: NERD domain-containing protein [Bacteroidota bacterium]|nr:NERD domain-containing protein [Bacteroidota bacterium]